MYIALKSDYACNKLIGATGSFYRVTKSGNPDRRYSLGKVKNPKPVVSKKDNWNIWDKLAAFCFIALFISIVVVTILPEILK